MLKFLKTKPARIAMIVCAAVAVLATAFFLQPGKSKAPAPAAPASETVLLSQQGEQGLLPSLDIDSILQQRLTEPVSAPASTLVAAVPSTFPAIQTQLSSTQTTKAAGTALRAQAPQSSAPAATTTRYGYASSTAPTQQPASSQASSVSTATTTPAPQSATCTISIRCDTILSNMDKLKAAKKDIVPLDGVILQSRPVTFTEGESVFDVFKRATQGAGIHREFTEVPAYGSAYIEGIGNIYEFDCGERSGWMYRVNGAFPNYGCSKYSLKAGDVVEWIYTCDLGKDIGGEDASGQRR